MTQPFADALTWVPKSRALGATLTRAHDLARAQNHPAVTLEHLLLALVEDPDASSVLLSCNIDLLKLNASIAEYVQQQPAGSAEMPEVAPALRTILEYAVAAARQSRRNEINGAIVLAAVIGEGKSEAARLLLASGLKFQDTVAALKRSATAQRPATGEAPPAQPAAQPASEPPASGEPLPPPASPPVPAHAPPTSASVTVEPYSLDDDPITTARRRIAAIRSGQIPSPLANGGGGHVSMLSPQSDGNAAVALAPAAALNGSGWAPPPLPQSAASGGRPVRMPPPVPPVAVAPVRRIGIAPELAPTSVAPWSDGAAAEAAEFDPALGKAQASRPPVEPVDLIRAIPSKIPLMAATTIEMRIPRAALLATVAAASAQSVQGRGSIVTRAVAVRLRAPGGGISIENASPETQWFDSRPGQRDDDEVRWRWVVTPRWRGRMPLQLSIAMRTVTADGLIVETNPPQQEVMVRVSGNLRAALASLAKWSLAALIGGVLTLLASVGVAGLLGRVFQ